MEISFPHYLLSKQSVDDRSLNRYVYERMVSELVLENIRIIELGAGIGTMLLRLIRWGFLTRAEYVLVDSMDENIEFAKRLISEWAEVNSYSVEIMNGEHLRLNDSLHDIHVYFERADIFDFIKKKPLQADLLIAHAVLDLLPLPESLPELFSLLREPGVAWFTINFDGVTTFEPVINYELDQKIEFLYHKSMRDGIGSQTGRRLFGYLGDLDFEILAAGASDWVVHPNNGKYQSDEAYFLNFIIHFFESSLGKSLELDQNAFSSWIAKRREQICSGKLVYIAHQMDFLVKQKRI